MHKIAASNPYSRTVNYAISESRDDMLKVIEYGGKPQIYYYAKFVSDGTDWIGKGDFGCRTPDEIRFSALKAAETASSYSELTIFNTNLWRSTKKPNPMYLKQDTRMEAS